jgi:hypothetical protein
MEMKTMTSFLKNIKGKLIINKIQVDVTLSEEIGKYESTFHYRFDKSFEMVHSSTVPGEYEECYVTKKITHTEPISPEKLTVWHLSRAPIADLGPFTGEQLRLITPISKKEYEEATKG